jgi:hypothetical protein
MKFGMQNNRRIRDTQMLFFFSSVTGIVVSVLRRIEDCVSYIAGRISD